MCCCLTLCTQTQEELARLQEEPGAATMEVDSEHSQSLPGGSCQLRSYDPFGNRTGGAIMGFCACGMAYPGLEVTSAESTTRVLEYLLKLHEAQPDFLHAGCDYTYHAFDDMCHLTRMIESRQEQHPRLALWLEQVSTAADSMHCGQYTATDACYCGLHVMQQSHLFASPCAVGVLQSCDGLISPARTAHWLYAPRCCYRCALWWTSFTSRTTGVTTATPGPTHTCGLSWTRPTCQSVSSGLNTWRGTSAHSGKDL